MKAFLESIEKRDEFNLFFYYLPTIFLFLTISLILQPWYSYYRWESGKDKRAINVAPLNHEYLYIPILGAAVFLLMGIGFFHLIKSQNRFIYSLIVYEIAAVLLLSTIVLSIEDSTNYNGKVVNESGTDVRFFNSILIGLRNGQPIWGIFFAILLIIGIVLVSVKLYMFYRIEMGKIREDQELNKQQRAENEKQRILSYINQLLQDLNPGEAVVLDRVTSLVQEQFPRMHQNYLTSLIIKGISESPLYEYSHLKGTIQRKVDLTTLETKGSTCRFCGKIIPEKTEFCPECGNKITICSICRKFIIFGEDRCLCPFCSTEFHETHILEALKVNGQCPVCHQPLKEHEVIKLELESKKT